MCFKLPWLVKANISRFTSRQDWQTEEAYPGLQVFTFSLFCPATHYKSCPLLPLSEAARAVGCRRSGGARASDWGEHRLLHRYAKLINSTAVFPTVYPVVTRNINGREPVTLKSHLPEALNGTKGETAHSEGPVGVGRQWKRWARCSRFLPRPEKEGFWMRRRMELAARRRRVSSAIRCWFRLWRGSG